MRCVQAGQAKMWVAVASEFHPWQHVIRRLHKENEKLIMEKQLLPNYRFPSFSRFTEPTHVPIASCRIISVSLQYLGRLFPVSSKKSLLWVTLKSVCPTVDLNVFLTSKAPKKSVSLKVLWIIFCNIMKFKAKTFFFCLPSPNTKENTLRHNTAQLRLSYQSTVAFLFCGFDCYRKNDKVASIVIAAGSICITQFFLRTIANRVNKVQVRRT